MAGTNGSANLFPESTSDGTLLEHVDRIDAIAKALMEESARLRARITGAAPAAVEKPHPIKGCLTFFDFLHKKRTGVPVIFNAVRDTAIIKRLLSTYGEDRVRELIAEFFKTDDEFTTRKTGFTIPAFAARAPGLISASTTPTRTAGVTRNTSENERNAQAGADLIRRQFGVNSNASR